MIKLSRARSLLYRSRFLQSNTHFVAFLVFDKIYTPSHRSKFPPKKKKQNFVKFCKKIFVGKLLTRSTRFTCSCTAQTLIFLKIYVKNFRIFRQNFAKFVIFEFFLVSFAQILMKFYRNFADILENVEIF